MSTTENLGVRRQATVFKKAHELSVLCDAEVAVIAFTRDGKLHEFSSTTMEHTLSRYKGKVKQSRPGDRRLREPAKLEEPKPSDSYSILHELQGQHAALSLEKSRRMGKELDGLSKEELCALMEQQLRAQLSVINKKKEQIEERLPRSKSREEQQEKDLIRGFEGMMKERSTYDFLQDHGWNNRMLFGTKLEAVSLHNRPSEDSDEHADLLELRL